jgi:nucleoside-diphosphate-sugar epimerase
MRVFVTGATGFVGSAVVPELIKAGHQVVGLARSDEALAALADVGAEAHRGDLEDLDSLRSGVTDSDGVIHLAFVHDFSQMQEAGRTDLRAIEAMGGELEGSDRPLVITSGVAGLATSRVATEEDSPDPSGPASHRMASEQAAAAFASRGVRSSIVRLAPTVHDVGDHGFIPFVVDIARDKGVSGYIGDGSNRWPAVHRLDAARLFRLALESAPAGTTLHGVAEEGVPSREIAEVIGRNLDVPVESVPVESGDKHFGWLGAFLSADMPASSALTRQRLGWEPSHSGLVADLDEGHYFREAHLAAAR